MKRVISISIALVVACTSLASGQSSMNKPLAEVSKAEEARRKEVRKPAKVLTNSDLKPAAATRSQDASQPSTTPTTASPNAATPEPEDEKPASAATSAKDQAYWSGRMRAARETLSRLQIFSESLQTRINSLQADFVNRDDPAQRDKIFQDRQKSLAELERVKKEIDDQNKQITAIEDEARRAGVPSGWLRPGA